MNTGWTWCLTGLIGLSVFPALANDACPTSAMRAHPATVNFRVDNDLFGGAQQDQGYTNGAVLTLVSPNLADYTNDPCLPAVARWINRHLERLHPGEFEQQNMIFRLSQSLYTPTDSARSDLILDDHPYVGVLLATFGYNARSGERLRTTQIGFGVAGPLALGQQVQNAVHHILGDDKFMGWDNQLRNEPVFMLLHARMRHWPFRHSAGGGIGADAITHWSAALGNLSTYANLGAELRFGGLLPDDFGSSPFNPAGENTAPPRGSRIQGRARGTSGQSVRDHECAVLHSLPLDGSTFRHGHSVNKRPWVGDIGYGVSIIHGRWKLTLARYHLTREFDGQAQTPVLGSFTISRAL